MDQQNRIHRSLLVLGLLVVAGGVLGCSSSNTNSNPLAALFPEMFAPTPSQAARDAFNLYDADLRRRSVTLLSNASWGGEEPYLKAYRMLIDDPDPTVRAAAVAALGRWGNLEDVPTLNRRMANDASDLVRWEAAKALQRIHSDKAVNPLIYAMINDKNADVRIAAANALGQYPTRGVFDALVGALSDDDYGVVDEAHRALHTLTGADFGDTGTEWWAWAKGNSDLFANQQTYYYPEFHKPKTLLDRAQFWKEFEKIAPNRPRGAEDMVEDPDLQSS